MECDTLEAAVDNRSDSELVLGEHGTVPAMY